MVKSIRHLFCPICGQHVQVECTPTNWPENYLLPDHDPLGNACPGMGRANLCQGMAVMVTIDMAKCKGCGCRVCHPSGLCQSCYTTEQARLFPPKVVICL